jgi:hypothetical protein
MTRLFNYWVYGGFLAGVMILALLPLFATDWSATFTTIFVLLPIYMLHQYEEHGGDRFRLYVNRTVGNGTEVLTPAAVFVINIGAVWILDVAVIYLAWAVDLGLGLIAVYLMLINAIVHIVGAIRSRSYNPGLVTAVILFLPAGGYALYRIQISGAATIMELITGIAIGAAVHVLIIGYALHRRSRAQAQLHTPTS